MNPTDTFDPLTGYLAMHKDMINDADSVVGVRLNAQYALGYAQALYDIQRIRPETLVLHREEIERLKVARLNVVEAAEG